MSHRDLARAFERALRRARIPVAYSAGFTPHPRISYHGAAPTGTASEAEYLELGLTEPVDPDQLRSALDESLPAGLDALECVAVRSGAAALADRIDASRWQVELPGVPVAECRAAVVAFVQRDRVEVERLTKDGRRVLDARRPVVRLSVLEPGVDLAVGAAAGASADAATGPCAILELVVRQATPAVRPDDVLAALRVVAGLDLPVGPRATRLAQGRLDESGRLADPLAPDREVARPARPPTGAAARSVEQREPSVGTTQRGQAGTTGLPET